MLLFDNLLASIYFYTYASLYDWYRSFRSTLADCPKGKFGISCENNCSSRNCKGSSASCHGLTGKCQEGCKPGWIGKDCSERSMSVISIHKYMIYYY